MQRAPVAARAGIAPNIRQGAASATAQKIRFIVHSSFGGEGSHMGDGTSRRNLASVHGCTHLSDFGDGSGQGGGERLTRLPGLRAHPRRARSHPAAALLVRSRGAYRHDGHGRDELLARAGWVEIGPDLALADLEQTEAEPAAVGRLHAILGADLELQGGRQALARHGAHQLGPPGAVGLLGRDAELARLAGPHATDALLERGEELTAPDQDRDRPAAPGRVDERATRQAHGVLERADAAGGDLHHSAPRASWRTIADRRSVAPVEPPLVTTDKPA